MGKRALATLGTRTMAVILAAALASGGAGMPLNAPEKDVSIPWSERLRFFVQPEEHKGRLGDYRTFMKFDDGTPVKTRQNWSRRREEIRTYWQRVMGKWPALNHTIALNEFLGHPGRIAMTMRDGHTPTAQSNAQAYVLLPKWRTAGRHGDPPGPDDVARILDVTRYGPEGRNRKPVKEGGPQG